MKQESFSDIEYSCRKKKTRREEFLEIMDDIIPWDEWVSLIVPHYPTGKRGRPPCQRQFEIVRKRRRNFVVFRRGG